MPRGRRGPGLIGTAVVVGGAAHMGAKSAQKNQDAQQQQQVQQPAEETVDPTKEIKKYKDLLDSGAKP